MKKFSIAVPLLLLASVFSFGQAPQGAFYTPSADVYVGYIATFPDYGPYLDSYRFDGFEIGVTKSLRPHLAITGSVDAVFGSTYSVKQFSYTVGPKYTLFTGRIRPYAIGQLGYAHQSSNGMYARDHHPPLAPHTTDYESGLTYRFGAGLDVQCTQHIYWRVVQWDIQPQPWARHTPWYVNFGSGIGYRF
jgi:hypothetical protein